MPRAPKQCGRLGCEERVIGRPYCPTHEAEQQKRTDQRRGTSRQRGYDARHDRERVKAKADAVAKRLPCPRCGQPMLAGQALDYGHSTARVFDPHARADRVEHAHCNRQAQHLRG